MQAAAPKRAPAQCRTQFGGSTGTSRRRSVSIETTPELAETFELAAAAAARSQPTPTFELAAPHSVESDEEPRSFGKKKKLFVSGQHKIEWDDIVSTCTEISTPAAHSPFKDAEAMPPRKPPQRARPSRRAAQAVSYKELSLHAKLTQGMVRRAEEAAARHATTEAADAARQTGRKEK